MMITVVPGPSFQLTKQVFVMSQLKDSGKKKKQVFVFHKPILVFLFIPTIWSKWDTNPHFLGE